MMKDADAEICPANLVSLENLTAAAPWEPPAFRLDRASGLMYALRASAPECDGLGAKVIVRSPDGWSRRLLAIYKLGNAWMLFDGRREWPLDSVAIAWAKGLRIVPGVTSLATLTLKCNGEVSEVRYLRPCLRHWFEGGWTLDDIDIGHLMARLKHNPAARARLEDASKADERL